MTVERQRNRIVSTLVLASLLQDAFLLVGNFCFALGHSAQNFANTFAFLFNDQARKYEALTGSSFAGQGELAQGEEGEGQ